MEISGILIEQPTMPGYDLGLMFAISAGLVLVGMVAGALGVKAGLPRKASTAMVALSSACVLGAAACFLLAYSGTKEYIEGLDRSSKANVAAIYNNYGLTPVEAENGFINNIAFLKSGVEFEATFTDHRGTEIEGSFKITEGSDGKRFGRIEVDGIQYQSTK